MRSGHGASLCAMALTLTTGCGTHRTPDTTRGPAPGAAPPALDAATIQKVIEEVAAARQLPVTRPIDVSLLERAEFLAALEPSPASAAEAAELSPEAAFLLGFDFVPPPGARGGIRTVAEVLEEQVAGFYDLDADRIVIPSVPASTAADALHQRAVLAHEVHHALQARHFPSFRDDEHATEDERLARLALVEGDAQAAMAAYLALENGIPVGRALRQVLEVNRDVPLGKVAHGEDRQALDGALALTREQLLFPYEAGALFVTDLYRAGGFPLVDLAYRDPPTTTEQILHPAKYVAGEPARPVHELPAPPEHRPVHGGVLGELAASTLFRRCAEREDTAVAAAAGWGGDRFGVFVGPDRRIALGWVSAWDTEADAIEVESLLARRNDDCFRNNALGLAASDYRVDAAIDVRRVGDVVIVVRGLQTAASAGWSAALARLVMPKPTPRPRFDVVLAPRTPLEEPRPGRINGDVWQSDWLGLVARIPRGVSTAKVEGFELHLQRSDVLIRGGVAFSDRVVSPRFIGETFHEVGSAIAAEAREAGARVSVIRDGERTTHLGRGIERVWRIDGTPIEVRMLLLPICAQTGSIVIVQVHGDPHARAVLDDWLASFRWIDGRAIPACRYLDPK